MLDVKSTVINFNGESLSGTTSLGTFNGTYDKGTVFLSANFNGELNQDEVDIIKADLANFISQIYSVVGNF